MKSERDIISNIWDQLYEEGYCDAAEVMNYCCKWSDKGAIRKVRYWLRNGIKHDGDYEVINNYIFKNLYNCEEIVPIDDLKYAFAVLEQTAKDNGLHLNYKLGEQP